MKQSYLLPLLFLASGLFAQKSALPTADKTALPFDPSQFQGPPPDTEPPTILCLNGLNVNLVQSGLITLWASDFLQSVTDNVTPIAEIKIGIRKSGTGTGFPVDADGNPVSSVTYDCLQLGAQSIELWAIDAAGNADYCETAVLIQDDFSYCSAGYDSFQVCVHFGCNGAPMVGVRMELFGNPIFQPPFLPVIDSITGPDGCVRLLLQPTNNTYVISATKEDEVLNGLTTHDLLLIGKHILGIEPLDNPYKMIAADINKSGSITSFDLVELRKLITGIYAELPNNTAWRFVDGDFEFPNPTNPFLSAYPEYLSVQDGQLLSTELIGIKIGDVDCSANLDSLAPPPDYPDAMLAMPDTILQAGLVYDIPLYMIENGAWQGYQFKLDFDAQKLEYQSMVLHDLTGPSNWNTMLSSVGALTTSWVQYDVPGGFGPGVPIATFRFRALETVALKDILSLGNAIRPEGYAGLSAEKRDLLLTFVPQFTPGPGSPSTEKSDSAADPKVLGDYEPPTLVCRNEALFVQLPGANLNVWHFIYSLDDNVTPVFKLETALRFAGTGIGFPVDAQGNPNDMLNFTCNDLGGQTLEIWARDASGNTTHCEASLALLDGTGDCLSTLSSGLPIIEVGTSTGLNDGVEDMSCSISGSNSNEPFFVQQYCDWPNDCYLYGVPVGSNVIVTPAKDDNPLNGVNTYDLVLIDKHIRGIELLDSPYKIIAADADRNGVIDSVDIAEFRKLIYGEYTDLPNNTSWRFVPKDFVFPDPMNPFATFFPESISIQNIHFNTHADFAGIKVGDVNNTAVANGTNEVPEERSPMEETPTVSIGLPYPNPTSGATSLPIYLPTAQNLHLEISDLAGRLLWSKDQNLEPGSHDLVIPALVLPGAGMYVWRVCAGSLVKSGKIIRQP